MQQIVRPWSSSLWTDPIEFGFYRTSQVFCGLWCGNELQAVGILSANSKPMLGRAEFRSLRHQIVREAVSRSAVDKPQPESRSRKIGMVLRISREYGKSNTKRAIRRARNRRESKLRPWSVQNFKKVPDPIGFVPHFDHRIVTPRKSRWTDLSRQHHCRRGLTSKFHVRLCSRWQRHIELLRLACRSEDDNARTLGLLTANRREDSIRIRAGDLFRVAAE